MFGRVPLRAAEQRVLDLWYAVRGKTPRDIWRNYEPKRMNEMPYRRPDGDPRADEIAGLVREIAANRRALLPHRAVVRDLGRIVKDPWKAGPVEGDRAALVESMPKRDKVSVRLDPDLAVQGCPRASATRGRRPARVQARTRRNGAGHRGRARLDLLVEIVGGSVDDVGGALLPKDLEAFADLAAERARRREPLAQGREKVERVESLVCALYGLPDDLTEAVVEHAIERAAR